MSSRNLLRGGDLVSCIEAPTVPAPRDALEDLEATFDAELSGLADWQRSEAAPTLAALRATLPGLAGHVDAERVRKMIHVFAPSDEIGIEEAAALVNKTPNRIRQLCRKGIGRYVPQERRWLVSRNRLLKHFKISGA
jgi:hypothetical protein